jgi:hypothetical protein
VLQEAWLAEKSKTLEMQAQQAPEKRQKTATPSARLSQLPVDFPARRIWVTADGFESLYESWSSNFIPR